jgi:hypothetical protein
MRSALRTSRLLLPFVAAGALVLTACGSEDPVVATPVAASPTAAASASPSAPAETAVSVTATPDPMAGVNLHVVATGFRWAPEHASGPAVDGEGHAHVYVDGTKVGRLYGEWMHLGLAAGRHEIRVSLNGNDHKDLDPPVEQTVVVEVPEPSKPMG